MNRPSLPLGLRLRSDRPSSSPPPGAVAAFFLGGGDPRAWLEEILRWELGATVEERLELLLLPRGPADREPAGALVVLPPGGAAIPAADRAGRARRGVPYAVRAGRMFLPADAGLHPPVTDAEIEALCRGYARLVFHPGLGLTGFDAGEAVRLWDLLATPPRRPTDWNAAHPGVPAGNGRLRSVRLAVPTLTWEDLFGGAGAEIGSEPADGPGAAEALPPGPSEPATKGAMDRLGRGLTKGIATAVSGITGALPHTPGIPRTWINDLEDWANGKLERFAADLENVRHRELLRLMDLLANDPERGLRHAIPMNRLLHRGRAGPGRRLDARDTDFNLGRLRGGGGQAMDPWDVPARLQADLLARYRELAGRELRLGRHRRAAYIFYAELLGDLLAAASALKQGQHFREAATLYQEHLNRPLEAAQCLAEAGDLAAAVAIYEEKARYREAAVLCLRAGDDENARRLFRLAVDERTRAGDLLAAAGLLEKSLNAPDEAAVVLRSGWPETPQAGRCLDALFDLHGRRGGHAAAGMLLADLAREPAPPALRLTLAETLAGVFARYPDAGLRHRAADLARVSIADGLDGDAASEAAARALLDVLRRLAPEDRLLARDVNRHLARRREADRARALADPEPSSRRERSPALPGGRVAPRLLRTFHLSAGVRWRTMRSAGTHFLAGGIRGDGDPVLVRGGWDGHGLQETRWMGSEASPAAELLLLDGPTGTGVQTVFQVLGAPALAPRSLPAGDRPWAKPTLVGTPDWWPRGVLTASVADGVVWVLRLVTHDEAPTGVVLSGHRTDDGKFIGNTGCPDVFSAGLAAGEVTPLLLARRGRRWLAVGERLHVLDPGDKPEQIAFESAIVGLVPMPAHARQGGALLLDGGEVLLRWGQPGGPGGHTQRLAEDLPRPLGAFTVDGRLVVLSGEGNEVRSFEPDSRSVRLRNTFAWNGPNPAAIVAGEGRGEFLVLSDEGIVQHLAWS